MESTLQDLLHRTGDNPLIHAAILVGVALLLATGGIGLLLANFPGKYALERWMVTRPGVLRTLNDFRRKVGREPLEPPD